MNIQVMGAMAFLDDGDVASKTAIIFHAGYVQAGSHEMTFPELVRAAYMARVQLSATGFYATPEIHWDRKAGRGKPFYYFAWGAACSKHPATTRPGSTAACWRPARICAN